MAHHVVSGWMDRLHLWVSVWLLGPSKIFSFYQIATHVSSWPHTISLFLARLDNCTFLHLNPCSCLLFHTCWLQALFRSDQTADLLDGILRRWHLRLHLSKSRWCNVDSKIILTIMERWCHLTSTICFNWMQVLNASSPLILWRVFVYALHYPSQATWKT